MHVFFWLSQAATNNKCNMNISPPPPPASICEEKCPSLTSLLHDEDKGGEGGGEGRMGGGLHAWTMGPQFGVGTR